MNSHSAKIFIATLPILLALGWLAVIPAKAQEQ